MAKFIPAQYCFRMDGRVEFICEHGIGHTIHVPEKYTKDWAWWSHGCCGCCSGVREELG